MERNNGKRRIALILAVCMLVLNCSTAFASDIDHPSNSKSGDSLIESREWIDYYVEDITVLNHFELNAKTECEIEGTDVNIEPPIPNWFTFQADEEGIYQIRFSGGYIGRGCVGLYRLTSDGKGVVYDDSKVFRETNDGSVMYFHAEEKELCYLDIGQYYFGTIYFSGEAEKADIPLLTSNPVIPKGEEGFASFTAPQNGYYSIVMESAEHNSQKEMKVYDENLDYMNGIEYIYQQKGLRELEMLWYLQGGKKYYVWADKDNFFDDFTEEYKSQSFRLKVNKINKYEYYDFGNCLSFLASGGSINYTGYDAGTTAYCCTFFTTGGSVNFLEYGENGIGNFSTGAGIKYKQRGKRYSGNHSVIVRCDYVGYNGKHRAMFATDSGINYMDSAWNFNTDDFKDQERKWYPKALDQPQYAPAGGTYQFAYDSLWKTEKPWKPLRQLYLVEPDDQWTYITEHTMEQDAIILGRFRGTPAVPLPGSEDPTPQPDPVPQPKPANPNSNTSTGTNLAQNIKKPVSPTGIKLNYSKITMRKGTRYTWLKASVQPTNASNYTLTWKSSNSKIVSVNKNGILQARKKGKAIITVSTSNGCKAKVKVTVTGQKIKVAKVTLNKKKVIMKKGRKIKLKAMIKPVNADMRKVTWQSSNTKVAVVNKQGVVKAKKPGKVKIICTAKENNKKRAVCTVQIRK